MKSLKLMIAGLGIAAAAIPTVVSAQNYGGWQTVNARQANLDRRIDMGIRNRSLTRAEGARLRAEFRQISRLEQRYRAGGLSQCRINSKYLALQIKAMELGKLGPL